MVLAEDQSLVQATVDDKVHTTSLLLQILEGYAFSGFPVLQPTAVLQSYSLSTTYVLCVGAPWYVLRLGIESMRRTCTLLDSMDSNKSTRFVSFIGRGTKAILYWIKFLKRTGKPSCIQAYDWAGLARRRCGPDVITVMGQWMLVGILNAKGIRQGRRLTTKPLLITKVTISN